MANLKYSDKHNMVAFLKKPNESVGFTEVVDFLKVRTLANGTQQLIASIDSKEYTITEASVRSKLQLADATGIHNLSDAEIYAGLATLGYVTEGDFVPLLPAMLAGAAVDPGEGSAQPAEPHHTPVDPISSTSQPPHPSPPPHSPPHSPLPSPPHPSPPPHSPPPSPHQSPPFSPPHYSPPRSYEAPLPEGNTSGSAEDSMQLKELMDIVPKLVSRIETLETELQQTKTTYGKAVLTLVKRVKILEKSLKRKTQKVVISGSEGEELEDQGRKIQDIDDDPLVSLVRESMKEKSTDFVTPTKASGEAQEEDISPTILEAAKTLSKIINTGLDAKEEINTGIKEVSTGSAKVDSGTASKGQREGKAPIVEEDIQATHKTKEQIRQEAAGLEEAIRLQAQMDEEVAKKIHLDKMLAKRVLEEQELSEQQLKRAEVQKAAQFYTEEYWDTIREKLEANTEVVKSLQGESISNDDFAKRMVEMINEKKKFYTEQKAKAKRNASITKGKDEVVKKEETEVPVKKTGMRRKQKVRKGINIDKTAQNEFNKERESYVKDKVKDASSELEIGVDVIPTAIKPPTIVNWKIISQSTMLKDFSRDELVELYRLVIKKYGANTLKEIYDKVLWGNLRTMFDPPLNEDAIWSLPLQQKMVSWRYYDKCAVHCLTLEASTIYMLADRKYPLSKDAYQVMLKMKLLDGTMDEVCYKLLNMIKKQAGIRK
ncbi:hypothetical protein Tco_1192944 [Tanacetum coccineum]